MNDAFRESDTILFRKSVTFQTGFGIIADEPFNVGSLTTTGSFLNTYNQIRAYGGISGTGGFITTGQTGNFYPSSNPNNYIDNSVFNGDGNLVTIGGDGTQDGVGFFYILNCQGIGVLSAVQNASLPDIDFFNDQLLQGGYFADPSVLTLDWNTKVLTGGAWTAQTGFNVGGSNAMTISQYRAGTINIPTATTSKFVNFSSNFTGINYAVSLTFDSNLATVNMASSTSKTLSGFTIGLNAAVVGGVNIDY